MIICCCRPRVTFRWIQWCDKMYQKGKKQKLEWFLCFVSEISMCWWCRSVNFECVLITYCVFWINTNRLGIMLMRSSRVAILNWTVTGALAATQRRETKRVKKATAIVQYTWKRYVWLFHYYDFTTNSMNTIYVKVQVLLFTSTVAFISFSLLLIFRAALNARGVCVCLWKCAKTNVNSANKWRETNGHHGWISERPMQK